MAPEGSMTASRFGPRPIFLSRGFFPKPFSLNRKILFAALALCAMLTSFGQNDITQPGDLIVGTSANTPISGVVTNAIDNQNSEYLNFDKVNTGFTVTPSVGATIVTGITLKSASAAPERDPASYILSGSNNGTAFTEIARGPVPSFSGRLFTQKFTFVNTNAYKIYRLIFPTVSNPTVANSMHIAEVELLGVVTPQDVTQPGDPIVGTSENTPVSGVVTNAIDDLAAPYRNLDKLNAGFIVTPKVGRTIVVGLTVKSGADAPERDPASFVLYGSDDGSLFTEVAAGDIPVFGGRGVTQQIGFENSTEYSSYKLIFPTVADPASADSMQIAEVEFLGFVAGSGAIPQFRTQPEDVQSLLGATVPFKVVINGPWDVQWYRNGFAIAGATGLTYESPPVTAANENDAYYAIARNGVLATRSATARIHIFMPALIKSIAINFMGGGASGTPSELAPTDVAGVWPQAYWNNAAGDSGNLFGETLRDSDNTPSEVFVDWQTAASWGTSVGNNTPDARMLSGYMDPQDGTTALVTFSNLRPGKYRIIAYTLNRAGAFTDADYSVAGATTSVIRIRPQNAGEYIADPVFIRGAGVNPNAREVANYVQFNSIAPSGDGTITFTAQSFSQPDETPPGSAPVNGVQIITSPSAPCFTITTTGKTVTLRWEDATFLLEHSDSVTGPYTPVSGVIGTTFSVNASAGSSFFRLVFP